MVQNLKNLRLRFKTECTSPVVNFRDGSRNSMVEQREDPGDLREGVQITSYQSVHQPFSDVRLRPEQERLRGKKVPKVKDEGKGVNSR